MASTYTPNYNFELMETGASRDIWGTHTNSNWTLIDTKLKTVADGFATADASNLATLRSEYKLWLPIGSIVMWHTGASGVVPAGWAICDGRVVTRTDGAGPIGTPNLIGRFILADLTSGTVGGSTSTAGTTGAVGAHTHSGATGNTTLTTAQMPSHTHDVANTMGAGNRVTISGSGGISEATRTSTATGGDQPHSHTIGSDGAHSHAVTVTFTPVFFTLIYIMRI